MRPEADTPPDVAWLTELGVDRNELGELNPCVPGEFTMPDTYYVNSATPRIVYRGTEEGTLPLVAGRWYLLPDDVVGRHPNLRHNAVSVSQAVRLTRTS